MSAEIYGALIENSPHLSFVFNLDSNKFIYVNKAFKSLLNTEIEILSTDFILTHVPPEDHEYIIKNLEEFLEGSIKKNIEFRIQVENDEKWIRLTPFLMKAETGMMILGNAQDITDEMHNLHSLKKFANKKNSILNILSHDLRGPLGIANTVTQLLNKEVDDPHLTNLISTITKVIKQSIDLIADLTEREFLETTDVELVKERINIAIKLKEYFEEYQNDGINRRKFKFSSSHETIFLELDEAKFVQIMNNLVSNSLKFTKDDGLISLNIKDQRNSVLFTFSDDGIGIPEQYHSTLFDKFTDARRKGLNGEPSVGLGLSIVKLIVEWHNGNIWVESKEGAGTTFCIEIPKN
jgi:two-component system sensor histidine kinase VicK